MQTKAWYCLVKNGQFDFDSIQGESKEGSGNTTAHCFCFVQRGNVKNIQK